MINQTDSGRTTVDADTWQLNALTEALGDLTLTVTESLSVGRGSDNDVVLGSKQVSRNHAVLSLLDGQLYVKDLDSSNGTFINEERIEGNKSSLLQVNDTLGFASFSFRVNAPVDAPASEPLAPVMTEEPMVSAETNVEAETVMAEPTVEEPAVEEPAVEEQGIEETIVKKTDIEELLPTTDHAEPALNTVATNPTASQKPSPEVQHDAMIATETAPTAAADSEPLVEEPAVQKAPVIDEAAHDKTTKTELQEEADPDVLRAKQAATAQFSGTANLGQPRDLGTEGNNAMDQTSSNPATAGQAEKKPSGGWFIWVFLAIIIIGLALWLFNMGGV